MASEKNLYNHLKSLFSKIKEVIKKQNLSDCKLFLDSKTTLNELVLLYAKPIPTQEFPFLKMIEDKPLWDIFVENNIDTCDIGLLTDKFTLLSIGEKLSVNSKISWKTFINKNFVNFPDIIQEFKNDETQVFKNMLEQNLINKNDTVKKMKI